jgi:hypothetical protein
MEKTMEGLEGLQDPALIAMVGGFMYPAIAYLKNLKVVKVVVETRPQLIPYLTMGLGVAVSLVTMYQVDAIEFNLIKGIVSGVVAGMAAGGVHATVKSHTKAKEETTT